MSNLQRTKDPIKVNGPTLGFRTRDSVGTYLIYHIDEGPGIACREMSDGINLITVGENGHYQRNTPVQGKGGGDQPFPGGTVTTRESTVELVGRRSQE
jgi:hypothetical protein